MNTYNVPISITILADSYEHAAEKVELYLDDASRYVPNDQNITAVYVEEEGIEEYANDGGA